MPQQHAIVTTTFRPARGTGQAADAARIAPFRRGGRRVAAAAAAAAAAADDDDNDDAAAAVSHDEELDAEGAGYGENVQLYTKDVAYLREKYGECEAVIKDALMESWPLHPDTATYPLMPIAEALVADVHHKRLARAARRTRAGSEAGRSDAPSSAAAVHREASAIASRLVEPHKHRAPSAASSRAQPQQQQAQQQARPRVHSGSDASSDGTLDIEAACAQLRLSPPRAVAAAALVPQPPPPPPPPRSASAARAPASPKLPALDVDAPILWMADASPRAPASALAPASVDASRARLGHARPRSVADSMPSSPARPTAKRPRSMQAPQSSARVAARSCSVQPPTSPSQAVRGAPASNSAACRTRASSRGKLSAPMAALQAGGGRDAGLRVVDDLPIALRRPPRH